MRQREPRGGPPFKQQEDPVMTRRSKQLIRRCPAGVPLTS